MTRIDQFESVFKSAHKPVFSHDPFLVGSPLVLTDLSEEAADSFAVLSGKYLGSRGGQVEHGPEADPAGKAEAPFQRVIKGADFNTIEDCLELIEGESPDLICTYRGLHSDCRRWGHSLGSYVEVLTQTVNVPVLVFPHPSAEEAIPAVEASCQHVMAMTDHLAGDSRLVNAALFFTPAEGTLHLTNLEDQQIFERYMEAIAKIPSIDSDTARESVLAQILKEGRDYIQSCRAVLAEQGLEVRIEETVELGLHIEDYKRLASSTQVDLLVMNTRDSGQLAMHGLAYELAVELNDIPLLLL